MQYSQAPEHQANIWAFKPHSSKLCSKTYMIHKILTLLTITEIYHQNIKNLEAVLHNVPFAAQLTTPHLSLPFHILHYSSDPFPSPLGCTSFWTAQHFCYLRQINDNDEATENLQRILKKKLQRGNLFRYKKNKTTQLLKDAWNQ